MCVGNSIGCHSSTVRASYLPLSSPLTCESHGVNGRHDGNVKARSVVEREVGVDLCR